MTWYDIQIRQAVIEGDRERAEEEKRASKAKERYSSLRRIVNYTNIPQRSREYLIPAEKIATRMLSFFEVFKSRLLGHKKTETRRKWQSPSFIADMMLAVKNKLYVRCWCGKKGNLIGYLRIFSIQEQRLRDMTHQNLVDEGLGNITLKEFIRDHMGGAKDTTVVYVVKFQLWPLIYR